MANPMTKPDSARVQSTQARGGKDMGPGGFAARGQSAGDRNENAKSGGQAAGQNTKGGQTAGQNTKGGGDKKK